MTCILLVAALCLPLLGLAAIALMVAYCDRHQLSRTQQWRDPLHTAQLDELQRRHRFDSECG